MLASKNLRHFNYMVSFAFWAYFIGWATFCVKMKKNCSDFCFFLHFAQFHQQLPLICRRLQCRFVSKAGFSRTTRGERCSSAASIVAATARCPAAHVATHGDTTTLARRSQKCLFLEPMMAWHGIGCSGEPQFEGIARMEGLFFDISFYET